MTSRLSRVVRRQLSSSRGRVAIAISCTAGVAMAELARPWPLKIVFDYGLLARPLPVWLQTLSPLMSQDRRVPLVAASLAIVAIALLKAGSAYAQLFVTSQIGGTLAHALRCELFAHLQRLSLSFHRQTRSGELLTKVTSDTNTIKDTLTDSALPLVTESITVVGMLLVMATIDLRLSAIVFLLVPLLLWTCTWRYRRIKDSARRQRHDEGRIATHLGEVLASVPVIQAFGREDYEQARFDRTSGETLEQTLRTTRLEAASARAVDIITAIGTCAVVLVGAFEALAGRMSPGNVLVFASYMASLYGPVRNVAKLSARVSKALVSAQRIREVLDVDPDVDDAPDARPAGPLRGEIAFERVSFAYRDGTRVLDDVSLRIAPGERVFVVGPSGSGKTTLVSLVLRFYDPLEGRVRVDGLDVRAVTRESLRRQMGVVPQDAILFGATVRENIAYGNLDATDDDIVAAARAANAHRFITSLERGYDTVIGERGGTLSGGQRQRIALARMFVRHAPILLLDEPMTGLDVESEAAVREALDRLSAGRTCLVVTHDLRSVGPGDRVLLVERGRLVADGTDTALRASNARYRAFCAAHPARQEPASLSADTRPATTTLSEASA